MVLPEGAHVILLGKGHRLAQEALKLFFEVYMCANTRAQSLAEQAELRE